MKYIYEFIGTFFLMLTIGMTVLSGPPAAIMAPLAIGSILAVMIFAGGHVSGAHYNPAVSFAVYLRGKLGLNEMLYYWVAQIAGAIIAAAAVLYLRGEGAPNPLGVDHPKALLAEFLFAFALCYVVLNVATALETHNNSYFGWAIGFTVLAGAYSVGTISGGAFNPAVGFGLSVLNLSTWSNLWIYIVGNLLGAAAAAFVFKAAHPRVLKG